MNGKLGLDKCLKVLYFTGYKSLRERRMHPQRIRSNCDHFLTCILPSLSLLSSTISVAFHQVDWSFSLNLSPCFLGRPRPLYCSGAPYKQQFERILIRQSTRYLFINLEQFGRQSCNDSSLRRPLSSKQRGKRKIRQ